MENKYISTEVEWLEKVEQSWKKDVEFSTSTETILQLLITWDQVWPRVSFPCFYRHPPHKIYIFKKDVILGVAALTLQHMFWALTTKTSHAKRHQREPTIHVGRYIYIILKNLDVTTKEKNDQSKHSFRRSNHNATV